MSQKSDIPALIGALLITGGVLGGGIWWFSQQSGNPLTQILPNQAGSSQSQGNQTATFAQVPNLPSGQFTYGGSTSWATIRQMVDSEIATARPEFQLRYINPIGESAGTATGIQMLLNRQIDFAQASRPLTTQEQQQAQQLGLTLKEVPVAIDGLAVAVNPSLSSINGLTLDQLKGIYTGTLTNWQQLGGPSLPIVPLSRAISSSGTVDLFVESVLGGGNFGRVVKIVRTTTEALQELNRSPGAIYFASAPEVVPQCTIKPLSIGRTASQLVAPYKNTLISPEQCPNQRNQLNDGAFQRGEYPLTRNLYVVFKQDGQRSQQGGEAYVSLLLTEQGQSLLEKSGFVRIR